MLTCLSPIRGYSHAMRFLAVILFLIVPFQSTAQTYPDFNSVYVNDFAAIIDAETEARIRAMLVELRKARDVEMTVVTMESRLSYGPSDSIESFATGLFNHWGVGDKDRNDGILVLIARTDRDMRIELGAGYNFAMDDRMARVIEHHFIPWFKRDEYALGIEAGVAEIIKRTNADYVEPVVTIGTRLKSGGQNVVSSVKSGGLFAWILGALGLVASGGGALGIRRYRRNRPRHCDICGRVMVRLDETSDDNWLEHGQIVEENLQSKDYDVWYCRHDDHVMIEGYRGWFSSYSACPNCRYRTLHSNRTVITSATTSSTGKARVDYSCRNCDHESTEYVTISRKSSSSSSSGGSFGGGSSSGGGASGSW